MTKKSFGYNTRYEFMVLFQLRSFALVANSASLYLVFESDEWSEEVKV